ncbi:MAG: hypothetical protein HRU19_28445 [Pseudobacteriovorax sp.]|nr:hypothetical protein [Pseudobacteriovorax sp.]
MTRVFQVLGMTYLILVLSCKAHLDSLLTTENPSQESADWPVDPRVHADLEATNPLDPSTFQPTVLNKEAYGKYSIGILLGKDHLDLQDEASFVASLFRFYDEHPIPHDYVETLMNDPFQTKWFQHRYLQFDPEAEPPRTVKALDQLEAKLQVCEKVYNRTGCCQKLALPWLLGKAKSIPTRDSYSWGTLQSKVWLTICVHEVREIPKSVAQIKTRFGDYDIEKDKWVQEFHPKSLAKQAGRRIFRLKGLTDSGDLVTVAQSISSSCHVEETELIYGKPKGDKIFVSYDAVGDRTPFGEFPTARGGVSIKTTPDSCMGCHYTFDTRRFKVARPSFQALQLAYYPGARSDDHCIKPEDQVIFHDVGS